MNKNSFISGLIFGLIFLALGGFLFSLRGESSLIIIIAIADFVFGAALILSGILSRNKKAPAAGGEAMFDDEPETVEPAEPFRSQPAQSFDRIPERSFDQPAQADNTQFGAASTETPDFSRMSPDQIRAEEMRLREESRRATTEARRLIDEARAAIDRANEDERALSAAQDESLVLTGAAQQNAFKNIDRLTKQASESSAAAAAAKQKARDARDEAKRLAELHNQAVQAAVGSMDDDF